MATIVHPLASLNTLDVTPEFEHVRKNIMIIPPQ